MSHGSTHRFPAEHHRAELARLMAIPAVAKRMAQKPKINFNFDVPDLAGYSTDGRTVYIDRQFAESDQLDSHEQPLVMHEHLEKTLIDVLGYSYAAAHEMATTAEHEVVHQIGLEPHAYEKLLRPFIKRAEHEKIKNPPLDLDCHPYYEDPDAQDLQILEHLAKLGVKDAQHPQVKLSHDVVKYGPGHAPEYCKVCAHYTQGNDETHNTCHLVVDPIMPKGWCRLWLRK